MAAEETMKIPQLKAIDAIPHFAVADLVRIQHKTSQTSAIVKSLSAKFGPFKIVSRRHYAPLSQFKFIYMDFPNSFESECTAIIQQLTVTTNQQSQQTNVSTSIANPEEYALPTELLMLIFDFCSPKTLHSITKISPYMKDLVESSMQMERIRQRRLAQPQVDSAWEDYHKARVYKTTALAMGLKQSKLETMAYEEVKNPHYSSGPRSRVYSLIDIDEILFESPEELQARRRRSNDAKERAAARTQVRETRLSELEAALRARNLQLRTDSKVCDDFIQGNKFALATAELVADVMEDMYFFFNYTDYPTRMQNVMRDFYEDFHFLGSRFFDTRTVEDFRINASREAKQRAVVVRRMNFGEINRFQRTIHGWGINLNV
jgi:hypothetical protein